MLRASKGASVLPAERCFRTRGGQKRVATQPQGPSMSAIKERQQKTWTSGNYAMVGNLLVAIGERLCETVDPRAGDKVLDVATGSGNTALAAARCFCEVTAIDYVPELVEQAKSRARAERLEVSFEVGDAENLPYPDASFDVVLSTLGVMFAPDQEKAAGEMLRVCRSGGKIGLANWTPDGFIGNMFRTMGKHAAPPPGIKPPPLWGTAERARELCGEALPPAGASPRPGGAGRPHCGARRSGCGSSSAKASPPWKRRARATPGGIRRRKLSSSTSATTTDPRSRRSSRSMRGARKPWRGTSKS